MSIPRGKAMLVGDVMMSLAQVPVVAERAILKEALEEMGKSRLGIACIVNEGNRLLGVLTDGDLRRMLLKVQKPFSAFFVDDALDHAIRTPITTQPSDTLDHAVALMGDKQIWDLPVTDGNGMLLGLLHLHPAVEVLLGIRKAGGGRGQ